MSDQVNPFISNPFAQGVDKQKKVPPPPAEPLPTSSPRVPLGLRPSPGRQTTTPTASTGKPASSPAATPVTEPQGTLARKNSAKLPKSSARQARKSSEDESALGVSDTPKSTIPKSTLNQSTVRKSSPRSAATSSPPPPPAPSPAYSGSGYKVQVLAKIPLSTNTNLPGRDYLWFAVYPIIPRVGDCLFQNGMYFRVDAVFLYENTTPGWCADIEVSYYTRRR